MSWLLVAIIVVGILIAIGVSRNNQSNGSSAPATTNGSGSSGASTNEPEVITDVSPALNVKNVKYIVITKDSTGVAPFATAGGGYSGDFRVINLGGINAYNGTKLLTKDDYADVNVTDQNSRNTASDAGLWQAVDNDPNTLLHTWGNNNVHTVELVLKSPQQITRVDIQNRRDCCWGRLFNTKMTLLDANKNVLHSTELMNVSGDKSYMFTY